MAGQTAKKLPEDEFFSALAIKRPELVLPGYWDTLGTNCDQWAAELTVSPFWRQATTELPRWRQEFRDKQAAELLSQSELPKFQGKSVVSIRSKLWRRGRTKSTFVDEAFSAAGAPIPALPDLVRTRIVCRYLDGVEFLAD